MWRDKAAKAISVLRRAQQLRQELLQPSPTDTERDEAIENCQSFADKMLEEIKLDKENRYYAVLSESPLRKLSADIKIIIRLAQQSRQEWSPMETAPRDEKAFIAHDETDYSILHWNAERECFFDEDGCLVTSKYYLGWMRPKLLPPKEKK